MSANPDDVLYGIVEKIASMYGKTTDQLDYHPLFQALLPVGRYHYVTPYSLWTRFFNAYEKYKGKDNLIDVLTSEIILNECDTRNIMHCVAEMDTEIYSVKCAEAICAVVGAEKFAELCGNPSSNGYSPILLASIRNPKLLKRIVELGGNNAIILLTVPQKSWCWTPISKTVRNGNIELFIWLCEQIHRINPNNIENTGISVYNLPGAVYCGLNFYWQESKAELRDQFIATAQQYGITIKNEFNVPLN
jgi:hypothetical protein